MKTLSARKSIFGDAKSPVAGASKRRDALRWKEQVREACLRRALCSRQKRQRKNLESDDDAVPALHLVEIDDEDPTTALHQVQMEAPDSPRRFLEEELRQRGVSVESPLHDNNSQQRTTTTVPDVEMTDAAGLRDEDDCPYTMSEDEFIELLEEIETELDTQLLEEQLGLDEEFMRYQVASFESDQAHQQQSREPPPAPPVFCPLCQATPLQEPPDTCDEHDIACSRCPFRLEAGVTTLAILRQRVDGAQMSHADFCYRASNAPSRSARRLIFSNPNPSTLTASCHYCGTFNSLYG